MAVFEDDVLTVSDWTEPAPLPFAPASVLGVVAIEGRMFTVLDLGREANAQIVAFRGNEQLALAVDAANEVTQQVDEELQVLNPRSLFATVMKGKERRRRSF